MKPNIEHLSELITHGECDKCGSSDANALYSDGHMYCFSCETYTPPDDEEVIASCKWVDEWLEWCCKQEIWDRSQQFWDKNLPSQVPPLSFLPDNVASTSRERSAHKTDVDD